MRPMGGFRCSPVSSVTTAARVVEHARSAAELGADVLVATAPFCTRTHGKEIAQHFRRLRAAVDLPLFAYDIPVQIAAALFGAYGTVLPRHTRPTPARNGATAVLDALAEAAAAVDPERPHTALGIAAAGVVDPRTGVVTSATDSIRGWASTPHWAPSSRTTPDTRSPATTTYAPRQDQNSRRRRRTARATGRRGGGMTITVPAGTWNGPHTELLVQ